MFDNLINSVVEGEEEELEKAVDNLLQHGVLAGDIINKGLIAAMDRVGELFKEDEIFVPEVMLSARLTALTIDRLTPLLGDDKQQRSGTVVIGTVKGDQHDIGKNLVALMLANSGFEVINLGKDVPAEDFCRAAAEHNAQIIGLSALLTTTMPAMAEVIKRLQEEGLREGVKVIIGGAPVSAAYAEQIGADGYSEDAASAVELCRRLLKKD